MFMQELKEITVNTLLQLSTSLFGEAGQSSQLLERYVADYRKLNPNARILRRDLAKNPLPHLSAERFQSFLAEPAQRSADQHAHVAASDELIDELRRADIISIGLPMYNFGVPSTLKAYFDHIARAGVTFRYTAQGPEGMLTGKKAVVFATRGGIYAGTSKDTQTGHVRDFLRLLGISDVEFVYAESLAMGSDAAQASLTGAHTRITQLSAPPRLAA
jgi:FMN-dependent NADH-azoreductase